MSDSSYVTTVGLGLVRDVFTERGEYSQYLGCLNEYLVTFFFSCFVSCGLSTFDFLFSLVETFPSDVFVNVSLTNLGLYHTSFILSLVSTMAEALGLTLAPVWAHTLMLE